MVRDVVKDFLRQIVNPTLIEFDIPQQVLNEIRKKLESAENKYKFSAFDGDPKRLADFLRSPDWKEIVTLLKQAKLEIVARKILEKVIESYDIDEVKKAAKEALKELKESKKEEESERLKDKVREVVGDKYLVKMSEDYVIVEGDTLFIKVSEESGKYVVNVRVIGRKECANWDECKKLIEEVKKVAEQLSA